LVFPVASKLCPEQEIVDWGDVRVDNRGLYNLKMICSPFGEHKTQWLYGTHYQNEFNWKQIIDYLNY